MFKHCFGNFLFQVKTNLSQRAGFISLFTVLSFLFTQSIDFSRLRAHLSSFQQFFQHRSQEKLQLYGKFHIQHSHKKQIVWKHGPNRPFYAFMLRTKLYQNPFFFTGHQIVNKPKSRAARTAFFLFHVKMQTKQDQTVL